MFLLNTPHDVYSYPLPPSPLFSIRSTGDQREPGWWVQQLIKLGAATQIQGISSVYVVWDGDLVPTRRWRLCERDALTGRVKYFIAILQGEARSVFNSTQYANCMKHVCGFEPLEPENGGTFVAHHMVFHTGYVNEMLELFASNVKLHKQKEQEQPSTHISNKSSSSSNTPWPLLIMALSRTFYRFSEYKTYATFMLKHHPHEFHYHDFDLFGQGGLRFREANDVCEKMLAACPLQDGGLSYSQVVQFVRQTLIAGSSSGERQGAATASPSAHACIPGYVQLDHVYGLEGIDLNMSASSPIDDLSHTRWQFEEEEEEEEDTRSVHSFSSISEDMRDDDATVTTTSSSFSSTSSIMCSLHKSFQFQVSAVDVASKDSSSSSSALVVDGVHAASGRGGRELHESYCYSDDDEESLTSNEDSLSSSPPSSCSPYDLSIGVCSPIAKIAKTATPSTTTTTTSTNSHPPRSSLSSLLKERQRLLSEQEGEW